MNDPVFDLLTGEKRLRQELTKAALTGLLSGVDIIMLLQEGRKLPGRDIAQAAVILANHTIDALNAPGWPKDFHPPTATEPGHVDTRKPVSQPANTSAGPAPLGADATPVPASSSTASAPSPEPAGKSEPPPSWKRAAAPLSKG